MLKTQKLINITFQHNLVVMASTLLTLLLDVYEERFDELLDFKKYRNLRSLCAMSHCWPHYLKYQKTLPKDWYACLSKIQLIITLVVNLHFVKV